MLASFHQAITSSVDPSQPGRQSATRIALLPPGTVQFELIVQRDVTGEVVKEAPQPLCWQPRSPSKSEKQCGGESGLISYTAADQKKTVGYFFKDCHDLKVIPANGDQVLFNLSQIKRNKELLAVDVQVSQRAQTQTNQPSSNGALTSTPLGPIGTICQGYVTALKDGFGFIEATTHDREIFFHFSNYEGETNLELGTEVEFTLASRTTTGGVSVSAENVQVLPKGTIPTPSLDSTVYNGEVVRPLRSLNPEQAEYAGLVKKIDEEEEQYEFGITSLTNKRELLQVGDSVTFQIDEENRAANIKAVRKKKKAVVDAVKGPYGFLAYEIEEGKKLFFHTSQVTDGVSLHPGDTVEFVLVTNQRNGKSSACNITRVGECKRPERLSKLRSVSLDDNGPRITVVRQPQGPDGTKGFTKPRLTRLPGTLACIGVNLSTIVGESEETGEIPPPAELVAPIATEI